MTRRARAVRFPAALALVALVAASLVLGPGGVGAQEGSVVARGSGVVPADGGDARFAFRLGLTDGVPEGRLAFESPTRTVKGSEILSIERDGFVVDFRGRGERNGSPTEFCVHVEDNTPTGEPDVFTIEEPSSGTGPCAGDEGGAITSGDIRVFPPPEPPPVPSPILAGAAKMNMTPFTLTDELLACMADTACPYHDIVQHSNPEASNPDGLPGGLFEQIGEEMSPSAATEWIGPTGVWGEPYEDDNGNGRFDTDETFTDDPANHSLTLGLNPPSTLGDIDSFQTYDGVYMAGYGNDRVALGAFDPIWARALFLRDTRTDLSVAWVSLDVTGYFSDFVGRVRARLPADLDVDHILLTHTHDHEAPDTLGIWGRDVTDDGTYPRFERYLEAKIAEAIEEAAATLQPARFRFGSIKPGEFFPTPSGAMEDLSEMISRGECRTPWFFDDELRAMQVVSDPTGSETIATLLNWGSHVESLDSANVYLSSDFPHATRTLLEDELGGVAIWTPGAQGVVEVVGDSCTGRWQREVFDGQTFEVAENGNPLVFDDPDPTARRERTYALGRVVGAAALAALGTEPLDPPEAEFEFLPPRLLCFPANNEGLVALALAGVIDKPFVTAECLATGKAVRGKSLFYAFRIGSGSFVTAPAEVWPELYYGISEINRSTFDPAVSGYDYSDLGPNPDYLDCSGRSHHGDVQPGAHSDRPFEPSIRDAQAARFADARVHFMVGYTPDLFGYSIPGYDFYWFAVPPGVGVPAVVGIPDPCGDIDPDLGFPGVRFRNHGREGTSAGSMLGPAIACELVRLLGDPLGEAAASEACSEWDFANLAGFPPDQLILEPGCPEDPEACAIRHY